MWITGVRDDSDASKRYIHMHQLLLCSTHRPSPPTHTPPPHRASAATSRVTAASSSSSSSHPDRTMQLFRRLPSQLLALAFAAASLSSSGAAAQRPLQMHEEDFDAIRGLAEYITSPSGLAALKDAHEQGLSGEDFNLGAGAGSELVPHAEQRRLGATTEECGVFLAASLAPHLWECFEMAQTVLTLVREENCETTYDFSPANMQRICTNQCHSVLHKTLVTMSQAGCSASALKQTCNECASGEKCVGTKCRSVCSPQLPCPCSYTCEDGACIPPKNSEMTLNDMGVNGFRIALEYLCTTSPQRQTYCFADLFTVLDKVDASTFCSKLRPVGCCTGTVFNFLTQCATANDTISTSVGTISLSDLEQFCPEVDFHTPCVNAPPIEPGSCLDGYYLSAAWPAAKASFVTVAVAAAMAAAMALLF